jgi:uncharacterized protein YegJ (DUF2314 family)
MKTVIFTLLGACIVTGAAAAPLNTSPAMTAAQLDRITAPYVARARVTYPAAKKRFLTGLPAGYTFLVMFRFEEPEKRGDKAFGEDMLVAVDRIQAGRIYGRLANQPRVMKSIERGAKVSRPEREIRNWIIEHPDGSEEGNAVGKFLERYFAPPQ